jgi:hypothetical protein
MSLYLLVYVMNAKCEAPSLGKGSYLPLTTRLEVRVTASAVFHLPEGRGKSAKALTLTFKRRAYVSGYAKGRWLGLPLRQAQGRQDGGVFYWNF